MAQNRHVIIDAFNVIFGDDDLKARFRLSQEEAKQALIALAQIIHDVDGHQVSVVFDGQGKSIDLAYPLRGDSFTVIHSTSNLSADGVIERMLARSANASRLVAVSNDRMIQDAAVANEAESMRVSRFLGWVASSQKRGLAQVKRNKKQSEGEWKNRLPL